MKLLLPLIALFVLSFFNHSMAQETRPELVPGLPLSLESYPIISDEIESTDGKKFPLVYRKPIGEGPFPVILIFPGGGRTPPKLWMDDFLTSATPTRFLKKGYMVVTSSRRIMQRLKTENPMSYSGGVVHDGIAAVKRAKMLPGADPESIVIFGGSAGGSLAIETAAQTSIAAVVVGEPSPHLWMGLGAERSRDIANFDDFLGFYTEEVKSFVRSMLGRIDCPFLLLHGDPTGFRRTDLLYVMRELVELEKRAKSIGYAGYKHGFYFGGGGRQMTGEKLDGVIEDTHTFILPHLRTKPKPLQL